jgi:hypothetical protein
MKLGIRIVGIASVLSVVAMAHGEGTTTPEGLWAKMAQCSTLGEDKTRHTCTDNALREAGMLTEETRASAKRKSFGLQKPEPLVAAAAAPAAPAPAASTAPSAAPAPKKETKEHLEVTLAKVEQGGDGKLVLTTADGAVWHQVESGALAQLPKQGEAMKIEARSLGGFMCQPSKYVSFRCYRSR